MLRPGTTQYHFYLWSYIYDMRNAALKKGKTIGFNKPKEFAKFIDANRRIPQLTLMDMRKLGIGFSIGNKCIK